MKREFLRLWMVQDFGWSRVASVPTCQGQEDWVGWGEAHASFHRVCQNCADGEGGYSRVFWNPSVTLRTSSSWNCRWGIFLTQFHSQYGRREASGGHACLTPCQTLLGGSRVYQRMHQLCPTSAHPQIFPIPCNRFLKKNHYLHI